MTTCSRFFGRALVLAPLALFLASSPGKSQVVINEIMFHPSSENSREEYLELYNPAGTNVNISGWQFTKGINFVFPSNTFVKANDYLVLVANRQAFAVKYPTITNYVGDYLIIRTTNVASGTLTNFENSLSNTREELKLEDASGNTIDSVAYADEGEWAVRQRGLNDLGYQGWTWYSEADGFGKSLELINANLPNEYGYNWGMSSTVQGTPGRVNSVASADGAPIISQVAHSPIIPQPTNTVVITARVIDDAPNPIVRAFYRVNNGTPPAFTSTTMFDDGAHGDGAAGDGVYGATLPQQANGSVVEFYVEAVDASNKTNSWPRPAVDVDGVTVLSRSTFAYNALYQVDSAAYTGSAPLYKLIMTPAEMTELGNMLSGAPNSDAAFNCTFISLDGQGLEIRYLTSVRNRGHGSRVGTPHNYRIGFVSDAPWRGVGALNMNARTPWTQTFGSALAQRSGVAGANSRAAQLRFNGGPGPGGTPSNNHYAANEDIGSQWQAEHFPDDSGGNTYRALRDIAPPNFDYRGTLASSYMNTYFKESNTSENDFTDLMTMLEVMGENQTGLFTVARARAVINVEQWMTHLALMNLYGNNETGLNTGYNDDYFMYRGVNDPRFILVYHDLDTILGQSGSLGTGASLFTATQVPGAGSGTAMNWFMHQPEFEPIYYRTLQRLLNTTFAKPSFDALMDQTLSFYVPQGTISSMKTWMDGRRAFVQSQLDSYFASNPQPPTATVSGEPRSPTPINTATLTVGGSNVVAYRYKLNNGAYGAETSVATPITVNSGGASSITNMVSVIGKSAAGVWQDTNSATTSKVWVVRTATPGIRLNEVLVQNTAALNWNGTFPDAIEFFNEGGTSVELGGLRLTDDLTNPNKFIFPSNTIVASGAYLVVYANDPDGTPGIHLGFNLSQSGEAVYLFDRGTNNTVLDSVVFGLQLTDLSVGRFGNSGEWKLCQPTFPGANSARTVGDVRSLRINEWLTAGTAQFAEDFIELYNPSSLPIDFGGTYFSDEPIGAPKRHVVPPLTFIQGNSFLKLTADGNKSAGADHLDFALSSDQGQISFMDSTLALIDCVSYGPQNPNVSQGRCPDGASNFQLMSVPTPGSPNVCPAAATPAATILPYSATWRYDQLNNYDGFPWMTPGFNDSAWSLGQGLFNAGGGSFGESIRTTLNAPNGRTIYYRSQFVLPTNPPVASLLLSHYVDDGAVVYLNGQEAYRYNLAAGPITYSTFAPNVSGSAPELGPIALPMTNVFAGTNYIAVEVHQTSASSPDTTMGVRLDVITNSATAAGLRISEVLANNTSIAEPDGSKPDWVEFYNPSASPVDMGNLSLTDDVANPRRWIFPAGSIVPANGYYRVFFDGGALPSSTNTGFGLKDTGDNVYLFTAGLSLLDSVTFGVQAVDFSIGRYPASSTNWSLLIPTGGSSNLLATLGDASQVKINEWMANPSAGDDWFELYNPNSQPVAIADYWLTDDLTTPTTRMQHQIAKLSFIGIGSFAYRTFDADGNPQNGANHVNFSLKAGGESVGYSAPNGTQLDGVAFGAQAVGVSQGRLPDGAANTVTFTVSQSKGDMNWLPLTNIVINEVLTHTDPPLEDAIELLNTNTASVNITGWYLSDAKNDLKKFQITNNISIPGGTFRVFYETQFNNALLQPFNFSLSSAHGDEVYLSQATNGVLTGYRAQVSFGAAANGVSFGRYRTSVGAFDFVPMSARTFGVDNPTTVEQFRTGTGLANAYPKVGPVVISEIMYNPPLIGTNDNTRDEFIELRNTTGSAVSLFDVNYPTNHWRLRGGVDFDFPANTTIAANGSLLIVGFDPTNTALLNAFKATYGLTNSSPVIGPWSGKLDNGGESIELERPDTPQLPPSDEAGFVPFLSVEKIIYSDKAPWTTNADGTGLSLQRVSLTGYGNDPTNWLAAAPTPTPGSTGGSGDRDGDGMPDAWETLYSFNPDSAADAGLDADNDGMTNLQEYLAGTDPRNANSKLALKISVVSLNSARLEFEAAATLNYTLEYRNSLSTGSWLNLSNIAASPGPRTIVITNSIPVPPRFYRVTRP